MTLGDDVSGRRVWLTSFWGFSPESWGCLGFTKEHHREHFFREFLEPAPSGLVAIYITTTAPRENQHMIGKIVGVMEMASQLGEARDFIDLDREPIVRKQLAEGRWRHAVAAKRAWRVRSDSRPAVGELANKSYWPARARHIGAQGVELCPEEVDRLMALPVVSAKVFGQ